jgi:hypothetical protein
LSRIRARWTANLGTDDNKKMPVSLERLVVQQEPHVITEKLICDCLVVRGPAGPGVRADLSAPWMRTYTHTRRTHTAARAAGPLISQPPPGPAQVGGGGHGKGGHDEQKRLSCPHEKMGHLRLSFQSLARIQNLRGLEGLVKLQLDNNRIERMENLSHLVSGLAVLAGQGAACRAAAGSSC